MSISKRCASEYKPHYIEYIYALRCPFTWDIFYIGKTQNLRTRLMSHISDGMSYNEKKCYSGYVNVKKCKKIKWIIENLGRPVIQIIEYSKIRTKIDHLEAGVREMYWINFYLKMFDTITNSAYKNRFWEYRQYKSDIEAKIPPSLQLYHFATDKEGKEIYDRKRLLKDGFIIPEQLYLDRYKDVRKTTYDFCYND